jgi:hypothetical protein
MARTFGWEARPPDAPDSTGMVDSAATLILLTASLLAALGIASVGVVTTSVVAIRVRRFRSARAARLRTPEHVLLPPE